MALKCPTCGAVNPDNARFCWNDGEKLVTTGFNPFQFTNGSSANSVKDWVSLVDKNWEESLEHFYAGNFANWFSGIGRGDLALGARKVASSERDQNIGLEKFLQTLGPDAPPTPQLTVSHATLDFGTVDVETISKGGYTRQFTLRNTGRGHLYGTIAASGSWITVDKTKFSGNSTTITVTTQATGRTATITIQSNGGTETLSVQMNPVYPVWNAIFSRESLIGAGVGLGLGYIIAKRIAYMPLILAPNPFLGLVMGLSFGLVISMSRWVRKIQRPVFYLIPVVWFMLGIGIPTHIGYQEYKIRTAKTGDVWAVEPLISALKGKDDSDVRTDAVLVLGEIGDARAVEPLIDALRNGRVPSHAAAWALGAIGDARAVAPLIDALKHESEDTHLLAWALGAIGESAVLPLIDVLKDRRWEIGASAAYALGEIGDARAVQPLIDALRDEDWHMRSYAAYALGEIGDAKAVAPLIDALKDGNESARKNAAAALGQIGDARAVQPLTNTLKDEDADVREAAREALAKIQKKVSLR